MSQRRLDTHPDGLKKANMPGELKHQTDSQIDDLHHRLALYERRESQQECVDQVRRFAWDMQDRDDIDKVWETVRGCLERHQVPFYNCGINIIEPHRQGVRLRYHSMRKADDWGLTTEAAEDNPLLQIHARGKTSYRPDLEADDPFGERDTVQKAHGAPVRAVVDVPFSRGTLSVNSLQPDAFSGEHIDFLERLAEALSEGFQRFDELAEYKHLEKRFRCLVDNPDLIEIEMDLEGRPLYVSPQTEDLLKQKAEAFIEDPALGIGLIHPDDLEALSPAFCRTVAGRPFKRREIRVRVGRHYRWFEIGLFPLRDPQGQVQSLQLVMVDIDQSKGLEARLKKAHAQAEVGERAKTRFLATLSGQLAEPLDDLIALGEKLQDPSTELDANTVRDCARSVIRKSACLHKFCDDSLELARFDLGLLKLETSRVEIRSLLEEAVRLVSVQAKLKKIRVRLQAIDLPTIEGDALKLKHVFYNVLENAVKFNQEGGRVTVTAEVVEGECRIVVEDTGVGIAAEDQDRLSSVSDDGSLVQRYGGLGVGIALSRGLVELHGGYLCLHSEGPGQGSSFHVTLPLKQEKPDKS